MIPVGISGWRRVVTVLTAAALVTGVGMPTPASAAHDLHSAKAAGVAKLKKQAERKTIKAVRKSLPGAGTPGLSEPPSPPKINVGCARSPKRGQPTAFKCRWKVSGELSGRVPVRCTGTATYKVRKKTVTRVTECKNREERQVPLLAAPHDVLFGYFEDFTTHGNLFNELGASGSNTLLEGIPWSGLQPSPGGAPATWNWALFDSVYARALAIGVRPVWTFTNAPCWAAADPCKGNAPNPVAGSRVADYAFAAAQIALRYPQSAGIEVWFEPNSAKFWGARPDPPAFSHLVGEAAAAIHATGTGVGVYSGGVVPGKGAADRHAMDQFLSEALAAGGIEGADAIGFHAVADVPFKPGQNPTEGYLGRMRINVQSLDTELADAQVNLPIAITQLSFSTAGPSPYTPDQQAEALVSSYEVLRRIAGIPIVLVSRLLDNGDGSKVQGFGVVHAHGAKKPAFCQLAAARGAPNPAGCP
jgi:hypothetical protein